MTHSTLTLGPLLFNWPADRMRDFYFRIADEADLDIVYFGEVVCAKRRPFHLPDYAAIIERLEAGGKRVILSTLQLVMDNKDKAAVDDILAFAGSHMIEANDLSSCAALSGRPHAIGPSVNVYNEATLAYFEQNGAHRVSVNAELPHQSLAALAQAAGGRLEVQVFGRAPLAISARCFHARQHGLAKSGCQYACDRDRDGLTVNTLDDQPFLTINGLQTLSHVYLCLANEIGTLEELGIHDFRMTPHDCDMVEVARLYRQCSDGAIAGDEVLAALMRLLPGATFANGFFHDAPGLQYIAGAA